MREIKFRAWNKDEIDWEPVPFIITEGLNPTKIIGFLDENEGQCLLEDGHAIVQYTGLKDKNGREIYEGDLFRWEDDAVGVIKYKDGSFYLETNIALPDDSAHAPGFYSPWLRVIKFELENELEIIGNIFENSELLEVAE